MAVNIFNVKIRYFINAKELFDNLKSMIGRQCNLNLNEKFELKCKEVNFIALLLSK